MKTEIEEIKRWIIDNAGQLANDLARSLKRKPRHNNWLNGNKRELDALLRSGMSQKEIARKFNVSAGAISRYACGHALRRKHDMVTTAKRDLALLKMNEMDGFTTGDIAASFGISRQRVHQILQTHGAL